MLWGIAGRRGCGKTHLMIQCAYWLAQRGRLILAYDPVHQFPEQFRRPFSDVAEADALYPIVAVSDCEPDDLMGLALSVGDCVVAVDEFDLLCSANTWKSEHARTIVRRGRHFRVGLIATFQRFVNVHGDFIALSNRISVFQTTKKSDVDRVAEELNEECAEAVKRLAPYEFVTWGGSESRVSRLGSGGNPPLDKAI